MRKELLRTKNHSLGIYNEDNYYVSQVRVQKEGKHKGKDREVNTTYHGSITEAAKKLAESMARTSKCTDLKTFLAEYKQASNQIQEALRLG